MNRVIYQLQQLRDYTDVHMRKHLVAALVLPHLQYCSIMLLGTGVVIDSKLQRLANKGTRYIFNLPRDTRISPYRRRLKWLSIADARTLAMACLVHKVLTSGAPSFLYDLLLVRANARSLRGQQRGQLLVPSYRADAYKTSFEVTAPIIWNSLPEVIKYSATHLAFKSQTKTHLLSSETMGEDEVHGV